MISCTVCNHLIDTTEVDVQVSLEANGAFVCDHCWESEDKYDDELTPCDLCNNQDTDTCEHCSNRTFKYSWEKADIPDEDDLPF